MKFEWDSRKARFNRVKHRVTFEEALTVFADPLAKIFDDVDHTESEAREIIVGHSVKQRVLLVSFVNRQDTIRIISSRVATRTERRTMKKAANRKSKVEGNLADLRREYRFDYRKARPNRFARQMKHTTVTVTLDPDVATVFQTSKSVNSLLRSVISAFAGRRKSRSRQKAVFRGFNQRAD